jgi:hypothetical protein
MITKILETGLENFIKIIEGYSNGINTDRYYDKLVDDCMKNADNKPAQQPQNTFQTNTGYQGNNSGYRKPYNNYRKNYGNNGGYQQQGSYNNPTQQNMSTYNPQ